MKVKKHKPVLVGKSKTGKKIFRGSYSYNAAELLGNKVTLSQSGRNIGRVILPTDKDAQGNRASDNERLFMGLGWAGNDPKFDPSITMEDVAPKEEDFVGIPFRLISATVVGAGTWKATDFSNVRVLRGSVGKLTDKPVYKDHETDLDNWVGVVRNPTWSKAFKSNGEDVPAGIDGIIMIDAKTNPKVARGAMLGSIFSNSVTVEFDWEMSHDFEDTWDFINKVGTIGSDGQMIRRVVTAIHNYHESSLVWLGADPFAKAINEDGSLKHIDSSSVYKFSKEDTKQCTPEEKTVLENNKKYVINFAIPKNVLSLNIHKAGKATETTKENYMKNKFLLAFIATYGAALGVSIEQLTAEDLTDDKANEMLAKLSVKDAEANGVAEANSKVVTALKAKAGEVENLEEHLANCTLIKTEDLTALQNEKEALIKDAAVGKKYVEDQKAEAIRLYKLSAGDKVDEAVVGLFSKAEPNEVEGLLKQYTKAATGKFSGTCKSCGSKDLSFQSSLTDTSNEDDAPTDENFVVPFAQLMGDAYKEEQAKFSNKQKK